MFFRDVVRFIKLQRELSTVMSVESLRLFVDDARRWVAKQTKQSTTTSSRNRTDQDSNDAIPVPPWNL